MIVGVFGGLRQVNGHRPTTWIALRNMLMRTSGSNIGTATIVPLMEGVTSRRPDCLREVSLRCGRYRQSGYDCGRQHGAAKTDPKCK